MKAGPLDGIKILEFAGIGPGPICGMLLSAADGVGTECTTLIARSACQSRMETVFVIDPPQGER